MAQNSNMIPLGTKAPEFELNDILSNKLIKLSSLTIDKGLVIMFICNHCPYVKLILPTLVKVASDYQKKGIIFLAINANDMINYPDDSPANMKNIAKQMHFTFPYLFDETQTIAKLYQAACTPDFFIFNNELACVYRGRFDEATPGNNQKVTGKDLTQALDQLITNQPLTVDQKPSIGCSIKWKA